MVLQIRIGLILICLIGFSATGFCTQGFRSDEKARYDEIQNTEDYIHLLEARRARGSSQSAESSESMAQEEVQKVAVKKIPANIETSVRPYVDEVSQSEEPALVVKKIRVPKSAPRTSRVIYENEKKENTFQVGVEGSYVRYKEPELNVTDNGGMAGIYGSYDLRPFEWETAPVSVLHFDAHGSYGQMNYKSDDGTAHGINDYIIEPRAWVGRDFDLSPSIMVTPYIGIGYRYLFDNFGSVDGGYDRRSQYLYAPVGFELSAQTPGWQFIFKPEYDFFIHGWQTSYFSNEEGFPNVSNPQKKGYGLRASLDIIKKGRDVNYVVSPYFRFWHIQDSEERTATGSIYQVTGIEPENKSTEIGVKLGVQF